QSGELIIVEVLGSVGPSIVADAASGIGDASALLGELECGPLGFAEHGRVAPRRDQAEPHWAFAGVQCVFGVHVSAGGAAVDLAGPDLPQLLSSSGKSRGGHDPAG